MKSKVKLSAYCIIITAVVIIALAIGIISSWGKNDDSIILLAILVALIAVSLYFFPKGIEATESKVIIHRQYSNKEFLYKDIASVSRCFPSPGGLRLCGSGGFFGYWGYFSDIVIGNYFGYYGDRSQCFLIKLKDGKQYVVSCLAPDEMLRVIETNLEPAT